MRAGIAAAISLGLLIFLTWRMLGPEGLTSAGAVAPVEVRTAVQSGLPVLLEFSADWCAPCKQVKPVVVELAEELKGRAQIVSVDVDANPEFASEYRVSALPCFVALRNGAETHRATGAIPKWEMRRLLGL